MAGFAYSSKEATTTDANEPTNWPSGWTYPGPPWPPGWYEDDGTTYGPGEEFVRQVETPTFSPEAGSYQYAQTVAISCGTSGATIYYTTDGSTPTTSSTQYSSAISVAATTTIKALAVKSGYTDSEVATGAFTITGAITISFQSPSDYEGIGSGRAFGADIKLTDEDGSAYTLTSGTVTFSKLNGAGTLAFSGDNYVTFASSSQERLDGLSYTLAGSSSEAWTLRAAFSDGTNDGTSDLNLNCFAPYLKTTMVDSGGSGITSIANDGTDSNSFYIEFEAFDGDGSTDTDYSGTATPYVDVDPDSVHTSLTSKMTIEGVSSSAPYADGTAVSDTWGSWSIPSALWAAGTAGKVTVKAKVENVVDEVGSDTAWFGASAQQMGGMEDSLTVLCRDYLTVAVGDTVYADTQESCEITCLDGTGGNESQYNGQDIRITASSGENTVQVKTASGDSYANSVDVTITNYEGAKYGWSGNLWLDAGAYDDDSVTVTAKVLDGDGTEISPNITGNDTATVAANADYLAFTSQPTDVTRGSNFSPQVAIAAKDAYGNTKTDEDGTATLTLNSADGSDALSSGTAVLSSGTWADDLSISGGDGTDSATLTAALFGYTDGTSDAFLISEYEYTLISCTRDGDKIYVHSGTSASIDDIFNSPGNAPDSLSHTGTNLISVDVSGGVGSEKIYVHNGNSSSILSSFSAPDENTYGITYDGTDLISSSDGSDKIYVHNNIGNTIKTSFAFTNPGALAYDGTNLLSVRKTYATPRLRVHDGISATVSTSFSMPAYTNDIAFNGTDLISCTDSPYKIYVHSGVSSTIKNSFAAPYSSPNGVTVVWNPDNE